MAPPSTRFRPGRYLAVFVGLVVVLYAVVFLTGDHRPTPKLGIDLQGGTRVTLTARTENGAAPTPDQLNLARQIIEQRVNGLGVGGAEVVQNGNNLVITVPGQSGDQARNLGQTARLFFRPVEKGPFPAGPQAPPGQGQPGQAQPAGQGQPGQAQPGQDQSTPGSPSQAPSSPASRAPSGGGGGGGSPGRTPAGQSVVLPRQAPPPAPAPPAGNGDGSDPRQAQAIAQARALRQSDDPAIQQQAIQALNCGAEDPLRGYDLPDHPLVACNEAGTQKFVLGTTILAGTDVANATGTSGPNGAGFVINIDFKAEGARLWGDYTNAHVGTAVAFVLDSQVVSDPATIREPSSANTQISGDFTQEQAQTLASNLRYGSLPLSFDTSEAQTISATLGLASLQAGLIAGLVGLALVFVYSLFYYRALGVLTILSLILSGLIVYAALVLLGRAIDFTLDLSGVAGFIVAIGITADSFVIFFERIKDEMREGRSFRSAVPRGWVRARRTILSGDAVSFLAAVVLYVLAVGQVRGFAFTLGMSTVLDLVVVFLVTHPLLSLASNSRLFSSPAWSGLGSVARATPPRPGSARRRTPTSTGGGRGGAR